MRVAELWRYPVTSLQDERLTGGEVGPEGPGRRPAVGAVRRHDRVRLTARRVPDLLFLTGRLLDVVQCVDRCVMVTRPQPGGIGRHNGVLKTIHRQRDGHLAIGALVARAGTVAVGDELTA